MALADLGKEAEFESLPPCVCDIGSQGPESLLPSFNVLGFSYTFQRFKLLIEHIRGFVFEQTLAAFGVFCRTLGQQRTEFLSGLWLPILLGLC